MTDAIVYNSNTGFAKQFAYSFAVQTGLPIYSVKELKRLKRGAHIIYFSWIMASGISRLSAVKNYCIDMVCAVGMMPYSEEYIKELKDKNKTEQLYYLRGGIRLYKLSLRQRFLIGIIRKTLLRKEKKNQASAEEKEMRKWLEKGHEAIDLDSLKPLLEWYNALPKEYVC